MNTHDELRKEIKALRACISRLSAANLHTSESPDLRTVLHEALEGARGLTAARFGAIATLGQAGQPGGLVTSGFAEEARRRLIEQMRDTSQPLRLADLPVYARALRFISDPILRKSLPNGASATACRVQTIRDNPRSGSGQERSSGPPTSHS